MTHYALNNYNNNNNKLLLQGESTQFVQETKYHHSVIKVQAWKMPQALEEDWEQ